MSTQPNILLILSDQHSPHVLGCAGDSVVRTPVLDGLAKRGVRFSDTSCANPLCVPSRMTFLTSRHSSDIRVWTNSCRLRSDIATFVHHLVNAGYSTTLCGRMHFNGPDQRHGFERRIIGDVHAKLEHIPGVTAGQHADGVKFAGPGRTAYDRYDEEVTKVCCEHLAALDKQPPNRPFFMTVGYVLPHCPFIARKELFDEYYETVDVPKLPEGYHDRLHPFMKGWREHREVDSITDEEVRIARAAYYGLVTTMDEFIGQIMDTLAGTQFADNTVVVYASDHGEMAGEHRMWWKSSFYQGSVGVPMIFSWPGHIAEGRTSDAVTNLLDIGPTLVDLAGGEPMPLVRGNSLRGFLEGDGRVPDWPDVTYSEYGGLQGDAPGRMVRKGKWKLNHYHGHGHQQLFNRDDDPGEWNDLGQDDDYLVIRDELLALANDGWSGETILEATARLSEDRKAIQPFNQISQSPQADPPDRWTAPDGCNVFPEE